MARETVEQKKHRTVLINEALKKLYPDAHCALDHRNPFELLVATILSAQTTDVRVNLVTPVLFRKYPNAAALASAPQADVEKIIQSTGFFRSKANSIRSTAADLLQKHAGQVPSTMDQLVELRGVGRKTANVVLGNAFGQNVGVVVDTHVGRLSLRLNLTRHVDPVRVELDLMKVVPQAEWTIFSHRLIFHGRQICVARKPRCESCPIFPLCPSGPKFLAQREKQ